MLQYNLDASVIKVSSTLMSFLRFYLFFRPTYLKPFIVIGGAEYLGKI